MPDTQRDVSAACRGCWFHYTGECPGAPDVVEVDDARCREVRREAELE